jgi:transcriptional regulator with XRE-family HTH domain
MKSMRETFASRLLKARKEAGFSRESLVSALMSREGIQVDALTIRNYEKAARWPRSPQLVESIAKLLNRPWSYFFETDSEPELYSELFQLLSSADHDDIRDVIGWLRASREGAILAAQSKQKKRKQA